MPKKVATPPEEVLCATCHEPIVAGGFGGWTHATTGWIACADQDEN